MRSFITTLISAALLAVPAFAHAKEHKKDVFVESIFTNSSSLYCSGTITQRGLVVTASHCAQNLSGEQAVSYVIHVGAKVNKKGTELVGGNQYSVNSENYYPQLPGIVFAKKNDKRMIGNDLAVLFSQDIRNLVKGNTLGWTPEQYPITGHDKNGYDEKSSFFIQLPGTQYVECEQKNLPIDGYGVRLANCQNIIRKGDSGSPVFQKINGERRLVGFVSGGDIFIPNDKKEYIGIQTFDPNKPIQVIKHAESQKSAAS